MTAKEMAYWKRWHRRGRRMFQLTISLIWLVGYGGLGCLLGSTHTPLSASITSVFFYCMLGHHWDQRTDRYLRQRDSDIQHPV